MLVVVDVRPGDCGIVGTEELREHMGSLRRGLQRTRAVIIRVSPFMDLSILKALPIGLIMFVAMVWGFFRRRAGQRAAQADYPALAERLGLVYRVPAHPKQIGQLYGTMRGFSVLVDPDEQRKLIVRFRSEPKLDLRSYEGPRCPIGMEYYTSRDRGVDNYLKTRYASPDIALCLDEVDLSHLLEPFRQRYRHAVKQLNITEHGVTCVLDFGNPPHIPVTAVEELMPALLDWAEAIEPPGLAVLPK
jgi:hypothetical protein